MFYQQAFDFSVFHQISGFQKKFFGIFVVEICVKGCKRLRQEWQQGTDCWRFIYHRIRFLLLKNAFFSNLEGEKKPKLSFCPNCGGAWLLS